MGSEMCIRDSNQSILKKFNINLFGIVTSSAGLVFGFSLTLFNSFFNIYMEKMFPSVDSNEWDSFKSNLNATFAFGGILCTLGSSYIMHLFGRRNINVSLGILNLISSLMLLIPNKAVAYTARLVSGKI